jgi:hypothetical protein
VVSGKERGKQIGRRESKYVGKMGEEKKREIEMLGQGNRMGKLRLYGTTNGGNK